MCKTDGVCFEIHSRVFFWLLRWKSHIPPVGVELWYSFHHEDHSKTPYPLGHDGDTLTGFGVQSGSAFFFWDIFLKTCITRSGDRTHADIRPLELKSNALTTRPSWCVKRIDFLLPDVLGPVSEFSNENQSYRQWGLNPDAHLTIGFQVKRLIHSATVVIHSACFKFDLFMGWNIGILYHENPWLPEVGIEPTRTFVHWNLSPTP